MQPDYITISTWNEHIAQPQLPDYTLLSMGLESDPTSNQRAFVGASVKKSFLQRVHQQHAFLITPS